MPGAGLDLIEAFFNRHVLPEIDPHGLPFEIETETSTQPVAHFGVGVIALIIEQGNATFHGEHFKGGNIGWIRPAPSPPSGPGHIMGVNQTIVVSDVGRSVFDNVAVEQLARSVVMRLGEQGRRGYLRDVGRGDRQTDQQEKEAKNQGVAPSVAKR